MPELRVRGQRAPDARVARVLGRARREPRVVAELAALGDRVERPEQPARAHVEAAHVELDLRLRVRPRADAAGGPDDDDVADDERRRRRARFDVVHRPAQAAAQVDDAGLAELAHRQPRIRVERPEIEARRHGQHAPLVAALPIGDAAPRRAARRRAKALAVAGAPDPQRLAAAGVDRNDIARRARRRVQHAVDHQRRRLALHLRRRAEVAAVPTPRDLQILDVLRVDLIERRVVLRREAAAVDGPLDGAALLRCALPSSAIAETPHSAAATRVVACCTNSPGLRMRNARGAASSSRRRTSSAARAARSRARANACPSRARAAPCPARAPRASARRTSTSDRRASTPES